MADVNKFMSKLLPILVQQKFDKDRVQRWLEKSLAEYAQYAKNQEEAQRRNMQMSVYRSLLKPELFKDQPYQAQKYIEYLKRALPSEYTGQLPMQEGFEDVMGGAEQAAKRAIIAMQNSMPVSEEDVEALVKAFGHKMPTENIKQILKGQAGKTATSLSVMGLMEKQKSRELKGKELEQRKVEHELDKKGKAPKDQKALVSLLERKRNSRWTIIGKLEKIDIENISGVKASTLINQLTSVNKDIKRLKGKLDVDPDEGYAELAEALKAKGFKKEDLMSNPDLIEKLKSQNYSPWLLLEYF